MAIPADWQNPIVVPAGATQKNVDPNQLLPSRMDLRKNRLETQEQLLDRGVDRLTAIQVNLDGIIWDGHHAVRAAAEKGHLVDVMVVAQPLKSCGQRILDLPVRDVP
jgi:hypothetical protein